MSNSDSEQDNNKVFVHDKNNKGIPRKKETYAKFADIFDQISRSVFRVKIIEKSPIQEITHSSHCKKTFFFDMVQEKNLIRCTLFDDDCDVYYDTIQLHKVYDVRNIDIKPINLKFNNLGCAYEVVIKKETTFSKVDEIDISEESFDASIKYTKLNEIPQLKDKSNINVIAAITHVSQLSSFTSSSGVPLQKLEITLKDDTDTQIKFILWNNYAAKFKYEVGDVIEVKGARVGIYAGAFTLNRLSTSLIKINTSNPQYDRIKKWYEEDESS